MAEPLTVEERELLNTTDEEIHARHQGLSFDEAKFVERISSGEPWQQLIQAHLYLDHVVSLLISDELINPDAIETSRMSFFQKLQLIEGMGLLGANVVSSIRVVNSLRNKIAHDLNFEISDQDVRNVVNSVPGWLQDVAKAEKGRDAGPLTFFEALRVLVLHSEVRRTQHIVSRLLNRKAQLRLQDVLSRRGAAAD